MNFLKMIRDTIILNYAKKSGCDFDGDLTYIFDNWYYVDMVNKIVDKQ